MAYGEAWPGCYWLRYRWQTSEENDGLTISAANVRAAYADGYDVQIAKVVAAGLASGVAAVKLDRDDLIGALDHGQNDAIIVGVAAMPEREGSIDFTGPSYVGICGLMVRAGFSYEYAISLQDFVGAALGLKDTPLDSAIDAVEGVDHLDPVPTVPDPVLSLLAVFCEAITFDANNIASMTQAHPEFVGIIFEEDEGYSEKTPASVGLGKGQDEVVRQMNVFLSDVDAAVRQRTWAEAVERQLT